MRRALLFTTFAALLAASPLAAQSNAIRGNAGFQANTLPVGDDDPSMQTTLGFTINYFQIQFNSVYVNHNGNITFGTPFGNFTPEPINNLPVPIIAPYWADVDTRGTGTITYGRDTVNNRPAFAVTWSNVGYYDSRTDKTNTFQVVLIDRSDTGQGNFDIEMNYARIQWEAGEADFGTNGLCQTSLCTPASAGYSNGSGAAGTSFSISGSLVAGAFLDVSNSALIRRSINSTIPGRLVFEARGGQVQQSFISSLSPASRTVNSGDFDLTINGSGFVTGAQVLFGNATLTPLSITPAAIVVRVGNSFLQTPGAIPVRVRQAGADSNAVDFNVVAAGPTLTALSPTSRAANSGDFQLTLTGTGFQQGAAVLFGATVLTPTSVTPTQIVTTVTNNLIQQAGPIQVRVRQNSVDTAPLTFTVAAPAAPVISSISPTSRGANTGDFPLTITGSNFASGATVLFGTTSLTPTSVTATQIVVTVTGNLIQQPGTVPVRVRASGVDSAPVNFTVTAIPTPAITSLSPATRVADSGDFALTITGQNFLTGAVVRFGGSVTLTPASLTTTQIVVNVPNGEIQNAGDYWVTVVQNNVSSNPVAFVVTPRPIVIPPINLSGGGATVNPGGSANTGLSLGAPAPVPLTGTLRLDFTPNATGLPTPYIDPALQFVSGGRFLNFTIPAGQTAAVLPNNGTYNAGTVAGTITLTMTELNGPAGSVLPSPAPTSTVTVNRTAPVITPGSVRIVPSTGGFTVEVQGYSTPRDLQRATFTFSASSAGRIEGDATFTVETGSLFTVWFGSAAGQNNGSRFLLSVPFTVTGDGNLVQSVSVTLTNSTGTSTAVSGGR